MRFDQLRALTIGEGGDRDWMDDGISPRWLEWKWARAGSPRTKLWTSLRGVQLLPSLTHLRCRINVLDVGDFDANAALWRQFADVELRVLPDCAVKPGERTTRYITVTMQHHWKRHYGVLKA